MTYAVDQLIQIGDYNSLVNTASGVYGIGNGERGYGQSAISLIPSVSISDLVRSTQWKPLRNVLQVMANHQGTSVTLPSDPNLDVDKLIRAYAGLLNSVSSTLTNRHNAAPSSMTLFPNQASTSYSSAWSNTISYTFNAVWTTVDKARYFWNSGGEILIRLTYTPDSVSSRNTAWNSFVADLGGFRIAWNQTRMISNYPGTNNSTNLGYYGLPLTPTLLWQGFNTQGSYAFPANNIAIYGWTVDGPGGANADNGRHLRFRLDVNDVVATGSNTVTGSWVSSVDVLKATTYLSQETPSVTIQSAFAGS